MLHDYVQEFETDQGQIDVRAMVSDLNSFNFSIETNEGYLPNSNRSISSGAYSIPGTVEKKDIFTDAYTVVDCKKVPQTQYDRIEKGLVRVSRYIKRHFAQSEQLSQQLRERGCDGQVDVQDLKSLIVDSCR
jgi:hypothetical protein